jgi:uncharacterized protein YjiS (DUF1127 family)
MTTIPIRSRNTTFAMTDVASWLGKKTVETVRAWQRRARSRRGLMALGERELWDIGLTRIDAEREARKPFWRE